MHRGIFHYFIVAILLLAASGCASFPQDKLAAVGDMPAVAHYQDKPSVYLDVRFFRGEPDGTSTQITGFDNELRSIVSKIADENQLFESYSFSADARNGADYTIELYYYNHGNQGAAAASGFISGFTLGVIPGAATDNYTLKAKIVGKNGNELSAVRNDDAIRTWIGIWFLPVMGNTPQKAVTQVLDNMTRDVFKRMIESDQLHYTLRDYRNVMHIAP